MILMSLNFKFVEREAPFEFNTASQLVALVAVQIFSKVFD